MAVWHGAENIELVPKIAHQITWDSQDGNPWIQASGLPSRIASKNGYTFDREVSTTTAIATKNPT